MIDPDMSKPMYLSDLTAQLAFDTNMGYALQLDTFLDAEKKIDRIDRQVDPKATLRTLHMDKRELFLKRLAG